MGFFHTGQARAEAPPPRDARAARETRPAAKPAMKVAVRPAKAQPQQRAHLAKLHHDGGAAAPTPAPTAAATNAKAEDWAEF
ncbi:hypothetical protein MTBUT4_650013 [Magnetospirillum sp. UT-4]|nr:hypothetical protein MTBUT4_650013 [Magnetospirillum sp. UT-4]